MPPLTKEQEDYIKNIQLKGKPVSKSKYGATKSGIAPVSFGEAAIEQQGSMPTAGDIATRASGVIKDAAKTAIDPIIAPAKAGLGALQGAAQGASALHKGQQQRMQTMQKFGAGSTKTLDTGEEVGEPSRFPTGAMSQYPFMGGEESDAAVSGKVVSGQPVTTEQVQPDDSIVPDQDTTAPSGDSQPYTRPATSPPDEREVAGYTVSDVSDEEAFKRFSATPARPATRAERGLTPVGPNNSGRGYGAVRRPVAGTGLDREIAPPKSIGDIIRYKREVGELERDRSFTEQTTRTGIAQQAADVAAGRQDVEAGVASIEAEKQGRLKSLQEEFSNPDTTESRRNEIEREVGVLGGKPVAQKKSGRMTDKQLFDSQFKLKDDFEKWQKEQKGSWVPFSKEATGLSTWAEFIRDTRPDQMYLVPEGDTSVEGTPADGAMTKKGYNALKSGDTYVGADGRTYRKP